MSYELHCGDCLEILPMLEAQSIDAIITDLPYGTTQCDWDEIIPFAPMWEQVKRILKPRGVFVTTASQPFTSKLVMSNLDWFKYAMVWEKDNATAPALAKVAPMKYHEDIAVFSAGEHTYNPQMWDAGRPTNKPGHRPRALAQGREKKYTGEQVLSNFRYPKSIVRFDRPKANNGLCHPTQKPQALFSYLVRTYTNPGDIVLDFCMGSGTTGVAAVKEGRNFVGVELDSGYFQVAQKRIEQAAMQLPLLEVT